MDIARASSLRKKQLRRTGYAATGVVVALMVTLGLSRLKPAAPTVEKASIWLDGVKRGPMVRQVRGVGVLTPEDKDPEFGRPTPMFKIQKPPFYAAWSTPILHDTLTGLKINRKCEVVDLHGRIIPGLYCAGESAGGFALHGLPRVTVFGRIAGREAANGKA